MDLSEVVLKELWSRSDIYFQFSFDEYKSFGSRIKKWRELNKLTQRDIANVIYNYKKVQNLPISTTDSIMRMYGKWESKSTDFNTVFSVQNIKILKELFKVDYDFLFCECDTPHRATKELSEKTCLSISAIEKLSALDKGYVGEESSSSACYSHVLLTTLDAIISDDDLLCYLSYFLTHLYYEEENDDEDMNTISILKPVNGCTDEDSILDGETIEIDIPNQLSVFTMTIASKLCILRDKLRKDSSDTFTIDSAIYETNSVCCEDTSFGDRLKIWREYNQCTQDYFADMIVSYRQEHNLSSISKSSVLRTYQNWEGKSNSEKDIRISLQDLKMLKNIMKCDYEYLLGDINDFKVASKDTEIILGLSKSSIEKLTRYGRSLSQHDSNVPAYASQILSSLDLIISDNALLSDLTYFLSDITYYPRLNFCSVLKPIEFDISSPADDAYRNLLFNDTELRNVFLPNICRSLIKLRERNHYNHMPLKQHIDNNYN